MHHVEGWQDAEDLVIEIGTVHTEVIGRKHLVAGVPGQHLLCNRIGDQITGWRW